MQFRLFVQRIHIQRLSTELPLEIGNLGDFGGRLGNFYATSVVKTTLVLGVFSQETIILAKKFCESMFSPKVT